MSELTPLTGEALNTLRGDFAQSGTNRLAMNAVTAAGIDKVALNYDRSRLLQRRFSVTVDNGEVTPSGPFRSLLAVQLAERGSFRGQEEHELEGVRVLPELRDVLRQAGARQLLP